MAIDKELLQDAGTIAGVYAKQIELMNQGSGQPATLFHSLYDEMRKIADEIAVHFTWGSDPGHLIEERRPHEPEDWLTYRINTYEQTTFSYAQKIIGLQKGALFHPDLHWLEYPEEIDTRIEGDDIKTYLSGGIPKVETIDRYMSESVLQMGNVDPNGWIAILPETPDYLIEDQGQFRRPYPTFIPSENVLAFPGGFPLVISTDYTSIKDRHMPGRVFFWFTDVATIQMREVRGDGENRVFDVLVYEEHNQGAPRIKQLGGIVAGIGSNVLDGEAQIYYLSHIQPTIPYFNTALKELSDLQAAITAHLHPKAYEAATNCPDCNGEKYIDGETCGGCGGSGLITSATSPLITYVVEPDDQGRVHPPAGYVDMDPAIIQKSMDWHNFNIKEAFRSVNMEMLYDQATSNQTAEAKRYDRELLHNLLRQVSGTIFPVYQWILDQINHARYFVILGEEALESNRVIVHAPVTFDTTLPNEAIEKVRLGVEAGLHPTTLIKIQEENIDRIFGVESLRGKLAKIALRCDPFPLHTPDDILALRASGANIDDVEIEMHNRITVLVDTANRNDPGFIEMSDDKQKEALIEVLAGMTESGPEE